MGIIQVQRGGEEGVGDLPKKRGRSRYYLSSQAEIGDPPTSLTPMSRSKSRSRKGHQAPLPTPASLGEERSNQVFFVNVNKVDRRFI